MATERAHGTHQVRALAHALGGEEAEAGLDWRFAPTLVGTPGLRRDWVPVAGGLEDPRWPADDRPRYGTALLVRRPVRRWRALPLRAGAARLPLVAADPTTGRRGVLLFPDEPRVAVAAELDGLTVVATHLSFSPVAAVRQLRRVRAWAAGLPGPVLLLGDLNLPAPVPARLLRARPLVGGASYPRSSPRVQLDHVLALPPLGDRRGGVVPVRGTPVAADLELGVGDHRPLLVDVEVSGRTG